MKPFLIKQLSDAESVILGLDFSRPEEYYRDIEQELGEIGFQGRVYFDLLLANGPSNRFFACDFENDKLSLDAIRKVPTNSELESLFLELIRKNPAIVDSGVLTKTQRDALIEGA